MLEIKNQKFQPLTFHLTGEKTLYLGPRERKTIAKDELSGELSAAKRRGMISITEVPEPVLKAAEVPVAGGKTKKKSGGK